MSLRVCRARKVCVEYDLFRGGGAEAPDELAAFEGGHAGPEQVPRLLCGQWMGPRGGGEGGAGIAG